MHLRKQCTNLTGVMLRSVGQNRIIEDEDDDEYEHDTSRADAAPLLAPRFQLLSPHLRCWATLLGLELLLDKRTDLFQGGSRG
jgi:hypothetical protein